MFFLGHNFLSGHLYTLKHKNLKTFSEKTRIFQPCFPFPPHFNYCTHHCRQITVWAYV